MLKRYYRLLVYASELYAEDTGNRRRPRLQPEVARAGLQAHRGDVLREPRDPRRGRGEDRRFIAEEPALRKLSPAVDTSCARRRHTLDAARRVASGDLRSG